jgi:hypothetical protein
MSKRRARIVFAKFAAAILVAAALAPSVSRMLAFAFSDPPALAVVCTAAHRGGSEPAPANESAPGYDCPACLIAARGLLEPPQPVDLGAVLRSDLGHVFAPPATTIARAPARVYATSPRGPPAFA